MAQHKSEFRNDSPGYCGVTTIEPGGKEKGIAVAPGDSIWLSEEEQIATANAPRKDEDNPFTNGTLTLVTPAQAIANRRPIGDTQQAQPNEAEHREKAEKAKADEEAKRKAAAEAEAKRLKEGQKQAQQGARPAPKRQSPDETAAPKQAQGRQAEGSRMSGEEVGVPDAPEKAAATSS